MAKKNKRFTLREPVDGRDLTKSIAVYLVSEYPEAQIETKCEEDTYFISFVQNVVVKKATKRKPLQARNVCTFITIHLTDKYCNVDIQGGMLSSEKESAGSKLVGNVVALGTAAVMLAFPAATPAVVGGMVGSGIIARMVMAANSVEKKVLGFIEGYIG